MPDSASLACKRQNQGLNPYLHPSPVSLTNICPGCLKIESSNRNLSKTTALEILECPPEEVVFELGLGRSLNRASLIAQLVKNTPAMQETLVRFLGQKDPLEKG